MLGEHNPLGDGNTTEEPVQFFVIADGELKVTRDNAGAVVVTSSITGEFEDLSCQILQAAARYTGAPAPPRSAYSCPCAADNGYDPEGTGDNCMYI